MKSPTSPRDSFRWFPLLAALLGVCLSCRFSTDPSPAAATEVGFLPLTAVASFTPPPPRRQACPIAPADVAEPPAMDDLTASPQQLRNYLNDGGDPSELTQGSSKLRLSRPDLDGDGWVDLAFSLREGAGTALETGTLLVFLCRQDRYELTFTASPRPDLGAPLVHSDEDLNADGQDDLLISRKQCGAHTCTAHVQVLIWGEGQLENRLEGPTDDLPTPSIEVRQGSGGPAEIAITAQGINSVGAGPFRPVTQIWTWNATTNRYQRTREEQQQTNYRVHVLHDAEAAAREGKYAQAMALYGRVIEDPSLQGWVDPTAEQRVLAGYANYRQVVTALQNGQREVAANALEALRSAVEAGEAESAYLDLADSFWSAYGLTGDVAFACQEARAYAAAHRPQILDPLYFGYANPSYAPQDVCPIEGG